MVQIVHKELIENNVELIVDDKITAFDINTVILESGKKINSEIVIIDIGVKPDSNLVKNEH